jgi:hypothetical protein
MTTLITPMVDKFDTFDSRAQVSFEELQKAALSSNATISQQISVLSDLLEQTLALQVQNNAAMTATAQLMQAGLEALTQSVNFVTATTRDVLRGLGIDQE